MNLRRRLSSFARALIRRNSFERDMADELRFDVEARVADLVASGLSPAAAARRARLEFGSVDGYAEECREARGLRWPDELRGDILYALRTFRRNPSFAAAALVSLALGIGANTLAFSVVHSLVLKPLPVDRPEQIVFVQGRGGAPGLSFPNYRDLRDRNQTMAGLAGYRITVMNVDAGDAAGPPARTWGYLATGNYFDLLGIAPEVGRVFHAEDDRRPNDAAMAVLSHEYWTSRFGADRSIVGRTIRINRLPYVVVGVAAPGFAGTERFYRPAIWVPMMMQAQIEIGNPWLESRAAGNTWIVGRLKAGTTASAAEANLNAVAAIIAREHPAADEGLHVRLTQPGFVGEALGRPVAAFTFGLLAIAGLVLLVACVNLASVLAARGADRQRELAIRVSIGASRGRIVRQLLVETVLLALAGGAVGCAIASAGTRALSAWHAPVDFPVQFDIAVDPAVMLFATLVSLASGVVFGIAPARRAARVDPIAAIKESREGDPLRRRWPMRDMLVAVQVSVCFVLVASSLMSLRGLQHALTMPLGFEPRGVAMLGFELGLGGYSRDQGMRFQQRALAAVERLPGVAAAAYGNSLPLSIDQSTTRVHAIEDAVPRASEMPRSVRYEVSPGYFRALGIRLVQGRDFEWGDTADRPLVAVVNEAFVRSVLHGRDPVGRRLRYGWSDAPIEIVGVVESGRYQSLTESPTSAMFVPIQQAYNTTTTLLARGDVPADQLVASMRQAIAALDPGLTIYGAGTVEQMLGFALFPNQVAAVALTAFGVLGMLLAATGINGTVAYAVSQRRREIGIRVAVGATSGSVLRLVLARMVGLIAIGAAIGFLMALAAGRLLASVVYQASPHDPIVFVSVGGILALVGIISCWAPAQRSLRIDPMIALRLE